MRAPRPTKRTAPPAISARLNAHVLLEPRADGRLAACFDGYAVDLGQFGAAALDRAQDLRTGLSLDAFAGGDRDIEKDIGLLVRRLARRGLLEYRLGPPGGNDQVIIEPQVPDYWPRMATLGDSDLIVLSRFAYLRRRGNDMVLESPRAGALFRLCDPTVATTLVMLSTPQRARKLRRQHGAAGMALFALLLDCQLLFKAAAAGSDDLRSIEGDDDLVLWDFHDLLFHTRSTEGRQANPLGGLYPYATMMPPPPAVRPRWPGRKIDLRKLSALPAASASPVARLLRERHSTRSFDDRQPITLAALAHFLDATARVQSTWKSRVDLGGGGPMVAYAARPYPSGGASYELELYLTVANCEGLARGFYHYDAGTHALVPITVNAPELDAQLTGAQFAMDSSGPPQVLITIAARFGRTAWKYSAIAYALILKDVGVLIQTLSLMATDMGLGGCAIGSSNIDLFARMTGIAFHIEGPVGQFALGTPEPDASD